MKHNDYDRSNGNVLRDGVLPDDDERIERLREEVRRYEQDLRELADA